MSTLPMPSAAALTPLVPPDAPGGSFAEPPARFSWADYGNLPLGAVVCLPLQQLSLEEVSRLTAGSVLRSAYHLTEALFLRVHGVEVANVTLEPVGSARGVRITNLDVRQPAFAPRTPAAESLRPTSPSAVPQHLRHCVVPLSLGFASRTMLIEEVLQLTPGQLLQMDTLLDEPVSLMLGSRVIAYGTPILQSDCYSIRINQMASQPPC